MARISELAMAAGDAKLKLDAFDKLIASARPGTDDRYLREIRADLMRSLQYWSKRLKRGR